MTSWLIGVGALSTAAVGLGVVTFGLLAARADVAVLGVPLVLSVVWGWFTRPGHGARVEVRHARGVAHTGRVHAVLTVDAEPGTETVRVRVTTAGYRERQAVLAARLGRPGREIEMSVETARTGVQRLFRVDHLTDAFEQVASTSPALVGPLLVTVFPTARPLRQLPLPFRLQGLTGPHTSRRVGDGSDLHDVHQFTPGDRLRRIDWRVSARRSLDTSTGRLGTLYVRRTFATADATVMIVMDSRDDVGQDVSTWGGGETARRDEATSLDLAREAATSIARRYLDGGDRVGLEDLGLRRRPVPPSGGRRQLERIAQRLAILAPEGTPGPRERAPQVPSGALLVVCSTFLDDEAARIATQWRAQGHRVIAVDVLPVVRTDHLDDYQGTAYRLVRLERGIRLTDLRRSGVELVHWEGDPDGFGSPVPAGVDLLVLARARQRGSVRHR